MGRLNSISVVQLLNRIKYHQERRKILMTWGGQRGLTGLIYMTKIHFLWRSCKIRGAMHGPLSLPVPTPMKYLVQ